MVVSEGEVRLRDARAADSSEVVMHKGMVGRVTSDGATTVASDIDTDRLTAWTDGTLRFDNTPVTEAVAELARWYDLDVRIADASLARRRVTATLRDEALSEILDLFALGLSARVERHGRVVVFHAL